MTTWTIEKNEKLIEVLAKYSLTIKEPVGSVSIVLDRKGIAIGSIALDGTIERKYSGQKALMGALIRDEIKNAIA